MSTVSGGNEESPKGLLSREVVGLWRRATVPLDTLPCLSTWQRSRKLSYDNCPGNVGPSKGHHSLVDSKEKRVALGYVPLLDVHFFIFPFFPNAKLAACIAKVPTTAANE